MISCTLNGKKYTVDFVSGRALREMAVPDAAEQIYHTLTGLMEKGKK